ncbi:MAG: peptidoglycan-binding lysin protein [Fibrobacteres bacterium]|nr:peptidoglycan-binding lysin protein [Fibrobacterota bacterium]
MRGKSGIIGTLLITAWLLTQAADASAESITGRVVGAGSTPLSGARVTLIKLGITATTGTDGRFELKLPGTGLVPWNTLANPGLADRGTGTGFAGRDALGKSASGSSAPHRILFPNGRASAASATSTVPADASAHAPDRAAFKAAAFAAPDTISLSKAGWFAKKSELASAEAKDMGDLSLERDLVGVGNIIYDKYDRQIVDAYMKQGLDSSLAMVVKAMIVIESSFKANAISMWDVQLPCGTHSYGLIQVTPGCERGYATLPAGTPVTATVSGGLNGNPAVLAWNDPADQASGNTIVQEAGIIIDLVTNPANPLWATSAFNPEYSIDNGAKALRNVMEEMKRKFNGCTAANYVQMGLAGYNQGSSTVSGCTSFSANGNTYQTNVLNQYRNFCKSAGVAPVY